MEYYKLQILNEFIKDTNIVNKQYIDLQKVTKSTLFACSDFNNRIRKQPS
jgi:hypothetical protein